MILKILGAITATKIISNFVSFIREAFLRERLNTDGWVLVTGCTGGIGLEFVKEFRKRNIKVFMLGRNCEEISKNLGGKGLCEYMNIDFNNINQESVRKSLETLIKSRKWSYIVNNVSYRCGSLSLKTLKWSEILQCINVGTFPMVYLTKLALSLPNKPKIVNVSAQNSFTTELFNCKPNISLPYLSVYEGVNNFQHAFSESLLAENVDLLNIMPGAVETKNTTSFLKKAKPFTVSASDYAKRALKYFHKRGSYVIHWKHKITNVFVNIFPYIKPLFIHQVSQDIAIELGSRDGNYSEILKKKR